MTSEYAEAAVRFADVLLPTHHSLLRSPDDPVQRCDCGRSMVVCEINSAARDAGLLAPVNAQASDPNSVLARAEPAPVERPVGTSTGRDRRGDRLG